MRKPFTPRSQERRIPFFLDLPAPAVENAPAMGKKGKKKKSDKEAGLKIVCRNRKARGDYFIEESYEFGLVLIGSEVKSLREGRASISEAYGRIKGGELWVVGMHVTPWVHSTYDRPDPLRERKLLAHKGEIKRLRGKVEERGYTLAPLRVYFNKSGKAKIEIGLARGKRQHDRRQDMKQRESNMEIERAIKRGRGG